MRPRILVIDNYDSFVYNLAHCLAMAGAEPEVVRNDRLDLDRIKARYQGVVISPGPGHPADPGDFGVCSEVLRTISTTVPTLGVCLGHQGIAHTFGGSVVRSSTPMHGKTSAVHHDGEGVFRGLPDPLTVGRYHSLCVADEGLPPELVVTARCDHGTIMGLRHRTYPIEGVQFHPESVLTDRGQDLMDNFVRSLGEGR